MTSWNGYGKKEAPNENTNSIGGLVESEVRALGKAMTYALGMGVKRKGT